MKIFISLLLATALIGCATNPQQVVKTVTVQVPVIQRAVAPDVLLSCGHTEPGFVFTPGPTPDSIVIEKKDQAAFQKWVEEKNRCIDAWRAWAN